MSLVLHCPRVVSFLSVLGFIFLIRTQSTWWFSSCRRVSSTGREPCGLYLYDEKKNVSKFVEGFTLIPANNGTYSRTYNNQSPCIERLVVKVPKLLPLICCKFQLYKAFTSIKRSWSLFTESQRPFCTAFHLRWTGT